MSYYGWKAVAYDFEARWEAGHRAGRVLRHERSALLAGDYSPIVRELEPEFEVGQECVVSKSRAQRGFVDGTEFVVAPLPRLTITVNRKVRRKDGAWTVRFDVYDCRDNPNFLRSKPPAMRDGDYSEASPDEVAEAAIESAYTSNPKQALDRVEAVPPEWQNVLSMQAHSRFAQHREKERREETAKRDLKALTSQIREVAITAARTGLDPQPFLTDIQRRINAQREELDRAA